MTNSPTISAALRIALGDLRVRLTLRPGADGKIVEKWLLNEADLPIEFYEVGRLRRLDGGDLADSHETLAVARFIAQDMLHLAHGLPLLWVCGRDHAAMWLKLFGRFGYEVRVLRGSLRPGNPYPPLVMYGPNGGSDDEHVMMMTRQP